MMDPYFLVPAMTNERIAKGEQRAAVLAALATSTPTRPKRLPRIAQFRISHNVDQSARVELTSHS
ncbi:hypothetical protein AYO38_03210 [bacterium SCGC AG-212-C10]|nr:hypothetical protein AYO38_03210 [bacterium SCGC AG-212-C10]